MGHWKYKNKNTDLPKDKKSVNLNIAEYVSVLLTENQNKKKPEKLSIYTKEYIEEQWEYYKDKVGFRYAQPKAEKGLLIEDFENGNYKPLYAVIKNPKYDAEVLLVIVTDENKILNLSIPIDCTLKDNSIKDIIKYYKNLNGTPDNNFWWNFNYNECTPIEVMIFYTSESHIDSLQGMWTKDVVLFDNYDEAKEYAEYINIINKQNRFLNEIKRSEKEFKKIKSLEATLNEVIEQTTREWQFNYALKQRHIQEVKDNLNNYNKNNNLEKYSHCKDY